MYSTVSTHDFGGLDLRSAADEAACIDCLNVDFDRPGRVRVRDGYDNFTSSAASARYIRLAPWYDRSGNKNLLAVRDDDVIEVLSSAGASVTTRTGQSGVAESLMFFARYGAPSQQRMYLSGANSFGSNTLYYWDGSAISSTAISFQVIGPIGVTPTDNRLAGQTSVGGADKLYFSDAGDPATWGANNFVTLTPGDGEVITAVVAWRELLFVFKESKFFVFYGTSTDSAGNPIFNYRPISTGAGCMAYNGYAVAPEGVYFVSRDGVYLTTGGPPSRISDAIEPIFTGATSSFFQSSAMNAARMTLFATVSMTYLNGRVYLSYPSGSATGNDRTLVYDTRTETWTIWALAAGAAGVSTFRVGDSDELVFGYVTGSNHIGRMNSTYSTDDGTAITSRYRTGFSDLGNDDEKSIANIELWGVGTVNYQLSKDFGSLDTASSVTLGTSPAIARGRAARRGGVPGTVFSWQAGASSGQWTLHRLNHRISSNKPSAAKSA